MLPADAPSAPWPARYRHSAPVVLPPAIRTDGKAPDVYIHLVHYGEGNEFRGALSEFWTALISQLPEQCALRFPYANVPPLTLEGSNGGVQVQFTWSREVGAPRRDYRHYTEQLTLAPGQWLQIRYNGRHTYWEDGGWYYEKHALNIGLADALIPTIFVDRAPDYQITDFADLH